MQLVPLEPGTTFPTYLHTGPEFIYMIDSEAVQSGQCLLPGWVGIAESGTVDDAFGSGTGSVFLLIYDLAQRFC